MGAPDIMPARTPLQQQDDFWSQGLQVGRQKQQRKAKRARDAKQFQKRELSQDLWGRQRGGGKGHWRKKLPGRGGGGAGGAHFHSGSLRSQIQDSVLALELTTSVNSDADDLATLTLSALAASAAAMGGANGDGMLTPALAATAAGAAAAAAPAANGAPGGSGGMAGVLAQQQRLAAIDSPRAGRTIRWGSAVGGARSGGSSHFWATPRRRGGGGGFAVGGGSVGAGGGALSLAPLRLSASTPPPLSSPTRTAAAGVFQDTLPSLTPKTKGMGGGVAPAAGGGIGITGGGALWSSTGGASAGAVTPVTPVCQPVSRDSIVHAIFEALFGKRRIMRGPRESFGGDWDDSDDDDDGEDPIDESWIKRSMDVSLFSSRALEFAVSSTRGADLLGSYVHADAVARMVDGLRREDPRVASPRLAILRAVHEHCPRLRLPMLCAGVAAAHDRLVALRGAAHAARALEVEAAPLPAVSAAVTVPGAAALASPRSGGGGGAAAAAGVQRDQGQTLLELLLHVLEHLPEPESPRSAARRSLPGAGGNGGTGGGDGGGLLRQFEREASEDGSVSSGSGSGSSTSAVAPGYAAAVAAARAAREGGECTWSPGERGETLRECLRFLCCAVKCYGLAPAVSSGGGSGGSGGMDTGFSASGGGGGGAAADAEELHLLRAAAAALVHAHAPAAGPLLSRVCASWPVGDGHREAGYLAVAGAALDAAGPSPPPPRSRACRALMRRLLTALRSPGVRVVQAAAALVLSPAALHALLAPCPEYVTAAKEALAANRDHWSPIVRDISEQSFDALLDLF